MFDDIRPPGPPKTKTHKKPPRLPKKALLGEPKEAEPAQKAQEQALPELSETMPPPPEVTIPIDEKGRTKFSKNPIKNLRNLHPKHWYNLNRTEKVMTLSGALIIVLAASICGYMLFFRHQAPINNNVPVVHAAVKPAKPATVPSPLTGVAVDPALAKRPITAIMIENSLDARPQSGLQDAGVVYEAVAEGGITRFMALFQESRPEYIGPVRSLRPYYIDFATPWDASIAHVGGSPDALSQIRNGGKDLDQFFNSGSYWRQTTRYAPHNVYTSFDKLDALNQAKGYTSSNAQSWPRKTDSPLKSPTATSIDLSPSSYYYNVHYDYDAKTNTYLRSEGGQPHIDTTSPSDPGQQLHPKVVIAVVMPLSDGPLDASGAYYSDYAVNGSGPVYVFQDGGVTQGTWLKADRGSQFQFKDDAGNPIKLNAGQTWITLVSSSSQVSYK